MRKAPGEALALLMAQKKYAGQETSVMRIFEKIGECVAVFHQRYGGKQHGDLHGSNIFYDEASNRVTLIDLANIGDKNRMMDMEYFAYSLRLVANSYPCVEQYIRHFEIGYARGRSTQIKALDRRFQPLQRLRIAMGLQKNSEEIGDEEDTDSEDEGVPVALRDDNTDTGIESGIEKEKTDDRQDLLPVLRPLTRWAQLDLLGVCVCSDARPGTPMWEEVEDPYDEIFAEHVSGRAGL
jgi:hypothetical protein